MARARPAYTIPESIGTSYPAPHDEPVKQRGYRRLAPEFGLTQFGVNLTRLPPGAWSSQRHWHALEDEFVYVLEGNVIMVTDDGEQNCHAGDCIGFKAGVMDAHHFINQGDTDAVLLTIGSRIEGDHGTYADIDMKFAPRSYQTPPALRGGYTNKNGKPYAK
jgi:uncharacterized cupin superfamily protein